MNSLLKRIWGGLKGSHGLDKEPLRLNRKRIYLLPTWHGLLFWSMLVLLLMGSINFGLSLGFVLTFLLASVAIVSILHSFRNLAGLVISSGRAEPVFAGQTASFLVTVENPSRRPRYSINLLRGKTPQTWAHVRASDHCAMTFPMQTSQRGLLKPGRFTLASHYPIGLFRAWCNIHLDLQCVVYPKPEVAPPPLPVSGNLNGNGGATGLTEEEFNSLRPYRLTDSPRIVAWKAVARGQGLVSKQFSGEMGTDLWLDWAQTFGLDTEARLSRLTSWVVQADAAHQRYGLRIPGNTLGPGLGEPHRRACLEALALYGLQH